MEKIRTKRRDAFFQQYVASMIQEAEKLGMTKDQVIAMVERGYEDERN